jgi:hypothetical protein
MQYGTALWDSVMNTLKTDWSMEKVSSQKLLYLFPDFESYLPCVFHGIACLMIIGGGEKHYRHDRQSHWMFANLALSTNPVNILNRGLKHLVKEGLVEGLTNDHSGTGFRIGSINTKIEHPLCEYKHSCSCCWKSIG